MPDYAAMYRKLFNSQTSAIEILQQAQRDTEEMYLSSPEPEIRLINTEDLPSDNSADEELLRPSCVNKQIPNASRQMRYKLRQQKLQHRSAIWKQ